MKYIYTKYEDRTSTRIYRYTEQTYNNLINNPESAWFCVHFYLDYGRWMITSTASISEREVILTEEEAEKLIVELELIK